MVVNETFITKEGLDKIKKELQQLKTVKRREIAWRIQEAKELGDLSENAEYAEAKNEQAFIEGRIIEIENIIKNAVIITDKKISDIVRIGSTIKVENNGIINTYTIVGSNEADPELGKISNESPLGKSFLGKKIGEIVETSVPKGTTKFKVISIK